MIPQHFLCARADSTLCFPLHLMLGEGYQQTSPLLPGSEGPRQWVSRSRGRKEPVGGTWQQGWAVNPHSASPQTQDALYTGAAPAPASHPSASSLPRIPGGLGDSNTQPGGPRVQSQLVRSRLGSERGMEQIPTCGHILLPQRGQVSK